MQDFALALDRNCLVCKELMSGRNPLEFNQVKLLTTVVLERVPVERYSAHTHPLRLLCCLDIMLK